MQLNNNRKQDIIIQIGLQNLRVGIIGQKVPRKSFKSKSILKILKNRQNHTQNQLIMDQLLSNIFFIFLNTTCQNKTVIILEKVYTQRFLLQLMANIMFKKLKIQKLQLCLSCVTPIYLTGKYSGLVVSGGASCVEMIAVYQGYPLFRNFQYLTVGTSRLNQIMRQAIIQANPEFDKQLIRKIPDQQLCEIRNNFSSIPSRNKQITIPIKRNKLKINQQKINFQYFFGDYENQQHNIAFSFLNLLNTIPIDCIQEVSKNIIFAGGLWRVQGMQNYFKKHVGELLCRFPKLQNLQIRKKLSFVNWGFNPSQVSWIGCSIGASVKNLQHLTMKRSEYQQKGRYIEKIMESYFLAN